MSAPPVARRYSRVKPPKELQVAWQSVHQKDVSRVEAMGLGGLFIFTADPPPVGNIVQLLFDLPQGEVRCRASVQNVKPGEGMGVKFISMTPEDRGRLDKFLRHFLTPS